MSRIKEEQYSLIDTIDFPERNEQWPPPEQSDVTAEANYKLSGIRVKPFWKNPDEWGIAGMQMVFNNGVESPWIEVDEPVSAETRNLTVDPRRQVRWINVSSLFLYQYVGIALWDQNQMPILEEDWNFYAYYYWDNPKEVPDGQHIVGFKCNTRSRDYIKNLSFLLGKEGQPGVYSELRFPSVYTYPDFDQFQAIKSSGRFPQLTRIWYEHDASLGKGKGGNLSQIQFGFDDDSKTPLFDPDRGEEYEFEKELVVIGQVRSLRVKERLKDGVFYRGLQMFGADGSAAVNVDWGEGGTWSELKVIPEGQQIIGIKFSRFKVIKSISFVLGPI